MKVISNTNNGIEKYKEDISEYVETYESMGFNYYTFISNNIPIVIFFLGKEPVNLFEPPGTPIGLIKIINFDQLYENIDGIFSKIMNITKENELKYTYISSLPEEHLQLTESLTKYNFQVKSQWIRMDKLLDDIKFPKSKLKLQKIERENAIEFLEIAERCTVGSYEGEEELENLREVPDRLLTFWYNMQELYYVIDENDIVGILNLSPNSISNLNNIGVCPKYRSQGYGKEILRVALKKLKDLGKKSAELRVHIKNHRAIGLYESFGFKIKQRTTDLIHWE